MGGCGGEKKRGGGGGGSEPETERRGYREHQRQWESKRERERDCLF